MVSSEYLGMVSTSLDRSLSLSLSHSVSLSLSHTHTHTHKLPLSPNKISGLWSQSIDFELVWENPKKFDFVMSGKKILKRDSAKTNIILWRWNKNSVQNCQKISRSETNITKSFLCDILKTDF